MTILLVEDEESIAAGLKFNFEQEGYDVAHVGDGPSAIEFVEQHASEVDLIVLDLMLPGMSGYETCRAIRDQEPELPVLVLSARTLSEDKAHAFDCGSDQYMTKPFALPELLSRVRQLLDRRNRRRLTQERGEDSQLVRIGRADVNFRTYEITVGAVTQQLTTTEIQLLKYLCEHEGDVLSRQQLLKDVWDQTADISTRTVDNFVMRLRRYIEDDPSQPRHLLSVRGTGYRFRASANDESASQEAT
jgi:two-component system OmpR family response regulator